MSHPSPSEDRDLRAAADGAVAAGVHVGDLPPASWVCRQRASAHLDAGLWQDAARELEQAREQGDESADLLVLLGLAYQQLREVRQVVSVLTHALQIDPDHAYAHALCGHNLLKLGLIEKARPHLERCLELDPRHRGAHRSMAALHAALGDHARAAAHMQAVQALADAGAPPPAPALSHRADADAAIAERLACITRQMRTDRARHRPPFTTFSGEGYRVTSKLSPLQSLALALAFPVFAGRATIDGAASPDPPLAPWVTHQARDLQRKLRPRRFARRRWSGDTHAGVARSRYLSLAGPSNAGPEHTLVAEMNAYALPHRTGYGVARPGTQSGTLEIVFRATGDQPHPLYRLCTEPQHFDGLFGAVTIDPRSALAALEPGSVPPDPEFTVILPLEKASVRLGSAFDLRRPAARQWLVDFFRDPPACTGDDDLAHGAWLREMAAEAGLELARIRDWPSLLPVVNTPDFGGNAFTELVATFLRRLGCDGLIFPSARCDHGVVIAHGGPVFAWGWNLVDYRDLPVPGSLAPEDIGPLPQLAGLRHHAELTDGTYAGSFVHLGNSLYQLATNQHLYDLYCREHAGAGLSARGFSWFRRRYGAGETGPTPVQCDRCGAETPVERALLPRCPACGRLGDTGVYVEVPHFLWERLRPL